MPRRAPKHCGIAGCLQIVPNGKRCPDHKSGWQTSPRTQSSRRTSAAGWKQQRAKALQRDGHMCQIRGPRCTVTATEVDHIVSVADGGGEDLSSLQSVCHNCHSAKTATEAAAARNGWKRTPEKHPGLLP